MNRADLERWKAMSLTPERTPMARATQFPSMAQQHLSDEQEIVRLRAALAEAVAEIERMANVALSELDGG